MKRFARLENRISQIKYDTLFYYLKLKLDTSILMLEDLTTHFIYEIWL